MRSDWYKNECGAFGYLAGQVTPQNLEIVLYWAEYLKVLKILIEMDFKLE